MEQSNGNGIVVKGITNADEIFTVLTEFKDYDFLRVVKEEDERRAYSEKLSKYADAVAAYLNGEVAGFMAEYTNNIESGCAYITFMAVKNDIGIMGSLVAMHMFSKMVAIAKSKNLPKIRVEVNMDNLSSVAPLKTIGFKKVAEAFDNSIYMEVSAETAEMKMDRLKKMLERTKNL